MREDSCREERRRAACASAATGRGNFYTSYTPLLFTPSRGAHASARVIDTVDKHAGHKRVAGEQLA